MAILQAVPGVEVKILANQLMLKEYVDPDATNTSPDATNISPDATNASPDATNTSGLAKSVTKYIESVPNTEFSVQINFTPEIYSQGQYALGTNIYLDGKIARSTMTRKNNAVGSLTYNSALTQEGNRWYNRRFMFCDLETCE